MYSPTRNASSSSIEHAADDVLDQGLRAEADGDTDHTGAGDQRPDLDAHGRQHHEQGNHQDDHEQDIAQDRQARSAGAPAGRASSSSTWAATLRRTASFESIDGAGEMPQELRHHRAMTMALSAAAGQARGEGVLHGHGDQIDMPRLGEQEGGRGTISKRTQAALQADLGDAGYAALAPVAAPAGRRI